MKTAMQEAIAHYEKLSEQGNNQAYMVAKYLKENFLQKEEEQIMLAYFEGVEKSINKDAISPQEYFNQTYNTL